MEPSTRCVGTRDSAGQVPGLSTCMFLLSFFKFILAQDTVTVILLQTCVCNILLVRLLYLNDSPVPSLSCKADLMVQSPWYHREQAPGKCVTL